VRVCVCVRVRVKTVFKSTGTSFTRLIVFTKKLLLWRSVVPDYGHMKYIDGAV